MPNIFEDTNPRELKELLQQIHSREAALPDFQRDFVWDPSATAELIVSIANNYPAGSLLRIRNTHDLFASREFQEAPALNGHKATYLVLDGQQRLTSLYQAFFGVGDHRYFLDLNALMDGADFEEAIFYLRAKTKKAKALAEQKTQIAERTLPLSVLRGGNGGYSKWTKKVARSLGNDTERFELEDRLDDIGEKWIQTIDDYRFPVVTLSDATNAEAVCTIFETLNRTGVKLSVFELLTARFWPQGVNLRELWAAAVTDHPIISDFEVDPYYLLQSIALLDRDRPACKRSDVLALSADAIRTWWEPTAQGLATTLETLRDDCGVLVPKWLPYTPILVPMAAVYARVGRDGSARDGADRARIVRWFWCSVFGQTYERSANSQSAKDFNELASWLRDGPQPDTIERFRFDRKLLLDTTPRQRSIYRGVISLLLSRRLRDFHTGSVITADLIAAERIDDHHVFPQAWLDKKGTTARLRDCVINRTLIDRTTNQKLGKSPPSSYLGRIRAALETVAPLDDFLASHELPTGDDSPLWRDDFEAFLDARMDAIWGLIREVTGATDDTDLMEGDPA